MLSVLLKVLKILIFFEQKKNLWEMESQLSKYFKGTPPTEIPADFYV